MDYRIKTFLILLMLVASCKTNKNVLKTSDEKMTETKVKEITETKSKQNERFREKQIVWQDNDRGTIITFDSIATVVIEESGAIRAGGFNPRIEQFDRSHSTTTIDAELEADKTEITTAKRDTSAIQQERTEEFKKQVKRTNYVGLIVAIIVCLIIFVGGMVIYKRLRI